MADIAASVLARLKIKLLKVVETISSLVRKNFSAAWGNRDMLKILC